ncbi:helix-turn-helix transcriptional regulator [Staphylococcus nepalensis]|uniref:helix-turn-helix transcriptional regulator n=1 Tax=Staphylococcus nepalensis TaxID=214473 RepID=UPI003F4927E1
MSNFGSDVFEELERKGITQRQLAQALGISAPYLNDILNGRREATLQKERIRAYLKEKEEAKHGQR